MKRLGGFVNRHIAIAITLLLVFGLSFFPQEMAYSAEYDYTAEPTLTWEYSNNPETDYDWPNKITTSGDSVYSYSTAYDVDGDVYYDYLEKFNASTGVLDASFGNNGQIIIPSLYSNDYLVDFNVRNGEIYITMKSSNGSGWKIYNVNNVSGEVDWTFEYEGLVGNNGSARTVIMGEDGLSVFHSEVVMGSYSKYYLTVVGYDGIEIASYTNEQSDTYAFLRSVATDGQNFYILSGNYSSAATSISAVDGADFSNVIWTKVYTFAEYDFSTMVLTISGDFLYFCGTTATEGIPKIGKINLTDGSEGWDGIMVAVGSSEQYSHDGVRAVSVDSTGIYFYGFISTTCGSDTCYGYSVERVDQNSAESTLLSEHYNMMGEDISDMYLESVVQADGHFFVAYEYSAEAGGSSSDYGWKIDRYDFPELAPDSGAPVFANLHDLAQSINLVEGADILDNPYEVRVRPLDDIGVVEVRFYVDGVLKTTDTSADVNGEYSFNWAEVADESKITATACDAVGNCASIDRNVLYMLPETTSLIYAFDTGKNNAEVFDYPYVVRSTSSTDFTICNIGVSSDCSSLVATVGTVSSVGGMMSHNGDYLVWHNKHFDYDLRNREVVLYKISTGEKTIIYTGSDTVNDEIHEVAVSSNYVVWSEGYYELKAYNITSGQIFTIFTGSEGYLFDVDGSTLVYTTLVSVGADYDYKMFSRDLLTGETKQLLLGSHINPGDWAPEPRFDGQYITYLDQRDVDNASELFVYDLATDHETMIYDGTGFNGMSNPAISDGYVYVKAQIEGLGVYDVISGNWAGITGDMNYLEYLIDGNRVYSESIDTLAPIITTVYTKDFVKPIFTNFDEAVDRINIASGQVITTNPYTIAVRPIDNGGNNIFLLAFEDQATDYIAGGIERVEFYVDNVLIGTDYTADFDGIYTCGWDTSEYHSDIKVLAYDVNGNVSLPLQVSTTVNLASFSTEEAGEEDSNNGSNNLEHRQTSVGIINGPNNGGDSDIADEEIRNQDYVIENRTSGGTEGFWENFLSGIVAFFSPIILGIKNIAVIIPPAIAYSLPYIIFLLLVVVAYLARKQVGSEIDNTKKFVEILKLEKTLYEEKSNFLMLSSHYLRTPMTLINGGIEVLVSKNKELAGKLSVIAKALGEKIESSLGKIEKNDIISDIEMPNVEEEKKRRYRSAYVVVPIVIIALVIIAADLIFVSIGKIDANAINFIIQILVFIIASQLVIYFYRLLFNEKKNNLKYRLTIDHERAIDEARSGFIQEMNAELGAEISKIEKLTKNKTDKDFDSIHEGEKRLDYVLGKLELLREIKNNGYKSDKNNINVDKALSVILADFAKDAKAKNITISRKDSDVSVVTDRKKLEYVLAALTDNAIKFGKEGGEVTLKTEKKDGDVLFIIKDNGVGISEEGMALLFKPFSRTDSALNFDHEGLGLSLYLSNMIANFLGGEIFVESKPKKGTTVTIRVKNRKTM